MAATAGGASQRRALAVGQEPGRLDRNSRFALRQHARHPPHVAGDGLGTSPRPETRSNPRKCMPLGYLASFHCASQPWLHVGGPVTARSRQSQADRAGGRAAHVRGEEIRPEMTPVAPRHVEQPWQGARPRRGRGQHPARRSPRTNEVRQSEPRERRTRALSLARTRAVSASGQHGGSRSLGAAAATVQPMAVSRRVRRRTNERVASLGLRR